MTEEINRSIFLSFLGLGSYNKITEKFDYEEAKYIFNGKTSRLTKFVQCAEVEILGANSFDAIIIIATQKSIDLHFEILENDLLKLGAKEIKCLVIEEKMDDKSQWSLFEKILGCIETEDCLTIDLTHGYRFIPIIFSAAISFLQKTKNVSLKGVYYGAFDVDRKNPPIIDMKDFYIITEWADAVSRLTDDIDMRKLVLLSQNPENKIRIGGKETISALLELTNAMRNIEINGINTKAKKALDNISIDDDIKSSTISILKEIIIDKYKNLTIEQAAPGEYDACYFKIQLVLIGLLITHKLYMQAFTVMREYIGSIGMIAIPKIKYCNSNGRSKRTKYAEIFISMIQYDDDKWNFKEEDEKVLSNLKIFYKKLSEFGVIAELKEFVKDMINIRNGFDHAWTSKACADDKIEDKAADFVKKLNKITSVLVDNSFIL